MLAFQNPGSYTVTYLSLDGKEILANPGTPPTSTYSVAVNLQAGQQYTLTLNGGGPSANLSWAMPSDLAPGIQQAVNAAKSAATAVVVVSDDTESEAADRAGLNLPSAQNELVSAVAAANPHTVVVVNAGAPVAMPWLSQVAAVLDAWYPGESNGTALGRSCSARWTRAATCPSLSRRASPRCRRRARASSPASTARSTTARGSTSATATTTQTTKRRCSRSASGCRIRNFRFSNLTDHPVERAELELEPGRHQLPLQRTVGQPGDGLGDRHQHRQDRRLRRSAARTWATPAWPESRRDS